MSPPDERSKSSNSARLETGTADVLPHNSGDVYRHFLTQLRQLTSAAGASLFVEGDDGGGYPALLLHGGKVGPIPELLSPAAASAAIAPIKAGIQASDPHSQPLIQVHASKAADGCLIRISGAVSEADSVRLPRADERRQPKRVQISQPNPGTLWIGLRYGLTGLPHEIEHLQDPSAGAPANHSDWLAHTMLMGANMVWEAHRLARLLRDPTSQLSGRAEFQAQLKTALHTATTQASRLGLLLVNPDEFGQINRRLNHESGDDALAQVAAMLCDCMRQSDRVFRYGGAVFAIIMPAADHSTVHAVATKILDTLSGTYLGGAVRLSFSIGAAVYEPGQEQEADLDELGLLRRSDQALNLAKRDGGGCAVIWHPEGATDALVGSDRLSGIFTANAEKDYRNMLLLWDTIAVMSSAADEARIASEFIERVQLALKPNWIALFGHDLQSPDAEPAPRLLAGSGQHSDGNVKQNLSDEQRRLIGMAQEVRRTERMRISSHNGAGENLAYAIPLLAEDHLVGCLYFEMGEAEPELDSSDLVFLNALAGQLALCLDRAELASRRRAEQDQESRQLRSEVHGLRQAVQSARLVYSSMQMESVLETARAAAATDVTVLINGESGTGKEMLARAVHELSERKGKPLITVDCGSISQNLIEAELFGHIKGAYTGAEKASEGRIAQADGGTLFLDEIGEIPLDVQAKLLRFVQEKEIHPVGAPHSRRVDVRIVAATNRDLATEAAAGNFREDLYYRLNVVALTAPPLRERPDDILPLARHFLEKFSLQYEKGPRQFSHCAEQTLLSYDWPGNVRELQNGILRAVVLSSEAVIKGELLEFENSATTAPDQIQLASAAPTLGAAPQSDVSHDLASAASAAATPAAAALAATTSAAAAHTEHDLGEPWHELARGLQEQVDAALADSGAAAVPLGRWLSEDLVLAVDQQVNGVARRAATRLGVAETTYRRQLEKVRRTEAQGLRARSEFWSQLQPVINHLSASLDESTDDNVIEGARAQLLQAVVARVGNSDETGSALMGITVPTYRRWLHRS
ncbi:MAG: sigma 54-interacting transcriptional regulator [Halieaceae bacterium]